MMVSVDDFVSIKGNLLDSQMATAFLTGIVAETDRFRNNKTSSATMTISAKLMASGANQQLVADKLEPTVSREQLNNVSSPKLGGQAGGPATGGEGGMKIDHENN